MQKTPLFILILLGLMACSKEDSQVVDCPDLPAEITPGARFFEFESDSGLTFVAWTSDSLVIADVEQQLTLPFSSRSKHINGRILVDESICDLNGSWSWYFDPTDWALSEFSIELCDGNPQYVEDNLDEYVNVIERYCPWGSKVSREVDRPF